MKLTQNQIQIMKKFYERPGLFDISPEDSYTPPMSLPKAKRMLIWDQFKKTRNLREISDNFELPLNILIGLRKTLESGKNVQPALFSECVFAQELAEILGLSFFASIDHQSDQTILDTRINEEKFASSLSIILSKCEEISIKPRFIYIDDENANIGLVQAGGPNGIDCIIFDIEKAQTFFVEFKEAASKTSEPDLPQYKEDGYLQKTTKFIKENPHFESMIDDQIKKELNFFTKAGSNVNDFSDESVAIAVLNNYHGKKHADVICVEDMNGALVMLPAGHAGIWAHTRGEIRPAGRNSLAVWTPIALKEIIEKKNGKIRNHKVQIPERNLIKVSGRGGDGTITKLKIGPLFFVRVEEVTIANGIAEFDLEKVRQLKPTISAHMFFKNLQYSRVLNHYQKELGI